MSGPLIDTHAHLDDGRFQNDLADVLHRAKAAGLDAVLTIATTAADSVANVRLAQKHDLLFASVGIQPNNLAQEPPDAWDQVLAVVRENRVVALGETGLDRYWKHTPFEQQEEFFARHLALSRTTGLPVVIHCREAEADTVRMLREDFDRDGPIRAVMHSFTGDLTTARACLEMGLSISFAGMLTYKNAQNLREVAAQLPLEKLLVETDSPYLAPVPHRGRRNEPAFVEHTARCLAEALGITAEAVFAATTANACTLFRI